MPLSRCVLCRLCRRLETHFTRWTNFFMCPIYSALFLLVLAIYAVIFIVTVLAGLTVRLCRCIFCCKVCACMPAAHARAYLELGAERAY